MDRVLRDLVGVDRFLVQRRGSHLHHALVRQQWHNHIGVADLLHLLIFVLAAVIIQRLCLDIALQSINMGGIGQLAVAALNRWQVKARLAARRVEVKLLAQHLDFVRMRVVHLNRILNGARIINRARGLNEPERLPALIGARQQHGISLGAVQGVEFGQHAKGTEFLFLSLLLGSAKGVNLFKAINA